VSEDSIQLANELVETRLVEPYAGKSGDVANVVVSDCH